MLTLCHSGDERYFQCSTQVLFRNSPKWLKTQFTVFIPCQIDCGCVFFWCWGVKVKLKSAIAPFNKHTFIELVAQVASTIFLLFFYLFTSKGCVEMNMQLERMKEEKSVKTRSIVSSLRTKWFIYVVCELWWQLIRTIFAFNCTEVISLSWAIDLICIKLKLLRLLFDSTIHFARLTKPSIWIAISAKCWANLDISRSHEPLSTSIRRVWESEWNDRERKSGRNRKRNPNAIQFIDHLLFDIVIQ